MAVVIDDVEFFIATRDYHHKIKVFFFYKDNMFAGRPTNVVKEPASIYFQCMDDRTWVVKNHQGFYKAPDDKIEELNQIILRENLQIIPWEYL
jgi:hypothetical protein